MTDLHTSNGVHKPDLDDRFTEIGTWLETLSGELERQRQDAEEAKRIAETRRKVDIQVAQLPKIKLKSPPHPKLERVLKGIMARDKKGHRLAALMIGPAGCGKSYIGEQIASILKLEFRFTTITAGMSEGHLLGRMLPTEATPKEVASRFNRLVKAGMPEEAAAQACNGSGTFRYVSAEFIDSYENGGVMLLDEADAGDANTLVCLNTALSSGRLHVPNRPDKPYAERHTDFVCLAAANTFGTGADRQYVGRNQLDEAFLDRFRGNQICMDYDPTIEEYLCPDKELLTRIQFYRNNITKAPPGSRIRRIISSRFAEQAYALKHTIDPGLDEEEIFESLFSGWSNEEKTKIKEGWIK